MILEIKLRLYLISIWLPALSKYVGTTVGATGSAGAVGPTGAKGATGASGPTGAKGYTATVSGTTLVLA